MYAVIHTGGKQYRVEPGERLEVERLAGDEGSELELTPVLVVDGDSVLATRSQLSGAKVKAKLVGAARGPKIDGFTYKPKSNNRRHYGHRQDLSVIEITGITKGRSKSGAKAKQDASTDADAESATGEG
ncbi:MAG TPA: 50S ribosomal protein L21 [Acidimicrobiia bacterium]|nr:50S ribosomal protein L21 [Acidimicrobiia bacterium]